MDTIPQFASGWLRFLKEIVIDHPKLRDENTYEPISSVKNEYCK